MRVLKLSPNHYKSYSIVSLASDISAGINYKLSFNCVFTAIRSHNLLLKNEK